MLLFGLFILLFALLGLHLFGGRYEDAISAGRIRESPPYHFNTLWMSIVTVFQVCISIKCAVDRPGVDTPLFRAARGH